MWKLLSGLLRQMFLFCTLGLVAICSFAVTSWSAETTSVLFLGIEQGDKISDKLTGELNEYLPRIGVQPIAAADLRPNDRKCTEPDCLSRLARQYGAGLIVGGSVSAHDERRQYLTLWLYDAAGGPSHDASDVAERAEITEKLKALCFRLFREYNSPTAAARKALPPPPPRRSRQVTTTIIQREITRPLSRTRKGLAIAFGALAGIALAGGIAYSIIDGQPTAGSCAVQCKWQTRDVGIAGFSVAGLSVVGLGLTLGLP